DRLSVVLRNPLAWTVRREHDQRYFTEIGFRNRRCKVVCCRTRRTNERDRSPKLAGHPKRNKPGAPFVADRAHGYARLTRERQRKRCAAGAWAQDDLVQPFLPAHGCNTINGGNRHFRLGW